MLIERHLGLRFDQDAANDLLTKALRIRLAATRRSCATYLDTFGVDSAAEIVALSELLTVGETYFLRHIEQFRALIEKVVPERFAAPGRSSPLSILSAGCASGEEAYSLAIVLREAAAPFGSTILGVDVNPAAVAKAKQGRYTSWSLRSVPETTRRRWFTVQGNDVELAPGLRDQVRFERRNLISDRELWRPNSYDVVFCRNVLMYFAPEVMAAVVRRIGESLVPGGYLFLGSAETLRGIDCDFQLRESHGTFYYQREPPTADLAGITAQDHRTDLRLVRATQPRMHRPVAVRQRHADLAPALTLLHQERFAEALIVLDALGSSPVPDPGLQLLRAALLTHAGNYPAAVTASRQLLTISGPGATGAAEVAGAHLLLATCRESELDVVGAIDHCRRAISCDPGFAMAHVQLARLKQRLSDAPAARHEYAISAQLLPDESERRILLFGGGFDREALLSLCRNQSAAPSSSQPNSAGERP